MRFLVFVGTTNIYCLRPWSTCFIGFYSGPVLLVDLAMVSWKYQFVAESNNIRAMRYRMGNVRLRIYAHASRPRPIFVCIYSHASRPSPRWFVLHPMQRRFKPVHSSQCRINQYNSSSRNTEYRPFYKYFLYFFSLHFF